VVADAGYSNGELNCHNQTSTIPAWYERAEEFTSIRRY